MPDRSVAAGEVTRILARATNGAGVDFDRLLILVYEELVAIANRRMAEERREHTLQATALVHEAFLRLLGDGEQAIRFDSRAHFFHAAAEAMRRILIEHARRRGRIKRGGDRRRLELDPITTPAAITEDSGDLLALDAAICRLMEQDERAAQIVRLRFFGGLSVEETGEALNLSPRTVKREWAFARAWLYQELAEERR